MKSDRRLRGLIRKAMFHAGWNDYYVAFLQCWMFVPYFTC